MSSSVLSVFQGTSNRTVLPLHKLPYIYVSDVVMGLIGRTGHYSSKNGCKQSGGCDQFVVSFRTLNMGHENEEDQDGS